MSVRKFFSCFAAGLAITFFLPVMCLCLTSEIASISQLNSSRYTVGSDSIDPVLDRVMENPPDAKILKFYSFLSEYLALQNEKIDALTCNEPEVISAKRNALENVRILPGYLGELIPAVAGLSDTSKNLYVTPETKESMTFSDIISEIKCVAVVRDDEKSSASENSKAGNFEAFRRKRIGVFTGSVQYDMVKNTIPDAEILYFDSIANIIGSLLAGKIDAAAVDETIAAEVERTNDSLIHMNEILGDSEVAFFFPKSPKNNPLANEINEYIRHIKSDGTLDEIRAIWFGNDEEQKITQDYSNLPATNGTIRIATDNETPIFSYVKDGKLTGYDIDIITRFCREKGYRPDISVITFPGIIPAISSGKCDVGIGGITITPERAESVSFSEPTCNIKSLLILKSSEQTQPSRDQIVDSESKTPLQNRASKNTNVSRRPKYLTLSDFDGKAIGMQPGVIDWEEWVAKNLPHSKVHYYNTYPDLVAALKTRKIEGFLVDYPVLALMAAEDNSLTFIDEPVGKPFGYSFVYAQTEAGKKLCDEMSEYIRKIKASGELDSILSKWQGADESAKIPFDVKTLRAKNGTLTYAAEGGYPPFTYYKGTDLAGIDIDIAARFCEAYGYGLDIQTMLFDAMIPAINSGKVDFAGDFTPSEEHEEAVYFSESYCDMNSVMACLNDGDSQNAEKSSYIVNIPLSNFAGKNVGLLISSDSAKVIESKIPGVKLSFFDSPSHVLQALLSGMIDAFYCAEPTAINIIQNHDNFAYIPDYVSITRNTTMFPKTEKGRKLCAEYADFLKTLSADGTLDTLAKKWITGTDESKKVTEDYSHLPSPNGTLTLSVTEGVMPFVFNKDNRIQGYDIDLAVMFCKHKGCGLNIEITNYNGVLSSLEAGKCDFSYSVQWTEERDKTMLFSPVPNSITGNVLLVMKHSENESDVNMNLSEPENPSAKTQYENEPSFWKDIASSFNKTFIREDRWRLFAEGIINTIIITVSSILLGVLLGFTAFMFCRTGSITANVITKFSVWLIKGTPIVVLLMILYYIIFGSVNINGIIVSIIAFTLTFGTSVYRMLTFGTGAVDRGQTEAAYALGFTDIQTFFIVILPQAALHFMPSFKEEVTMLIKSTSVVGYIAVQDLTKMGDIVRSRTYEAFFPLIAVAMIYFILAGMLNIIVDIIHTRITPSRRKPEDILRGIDTREDDNDD